MSLCVQIKIYNHMSQGLDHNTGMSQGGIFVSSMGGGGVNWNGIVQS